MSLSSGKKFSLCTRLFIQVCKVIIVVVRRKETEILELKMNILF